MTAADFAILNEKPDAPKGSDGFITLVSKNAKTSVFVVENSGNEKRQRRFHLARTAFEVTIDNNTLRPTQLKMTSKVKGTASGMPVDGTMKGMRVSKLKMN